MCRQIAQRKGQKMIIQLDPPLPLITPKGSALAHFLIDYGIENDLYWVCAQQDTGECWTWSNRDIRFEKNVTIGRVPAKEEVKIAEQPKPDHEHSWVFNHRGVVCCWCGIKQPKEQE